MSVWIEPVYDRTRADLDYAIGKIREWKGQENPTIEDLKACFNVSDINRIENNINHLSKLLNDYYYKQKIEHKEWAMLDIPTSSDIDDLRSKVLLLIDVYFKVVDMPDVPSKLVTYVEVNQIEKILFMLKEAVNNMEKSFKKCGTFKCGQKAFLPLKRS